MTKVRAILNPSAAAGRAGVRIREARTLLNQTMPGIEWCESHNAEHLLALCREAAQADYGQVIVAGGDGTVHYAVRGLAHSNTALGILPTGTGNDFAHAAGIPRDALAAAHVLLRGQTRQVDLGSANGIPFCCVAGFGFDTPALSFLGRLPLRRGPLAYQLAAVQGLLCYPGCELTICMNGQQLQQHIFFAAFCNTPTYAGGNRISANQI